MLRRGARLSCPYHLPLHLNNQQLNLYDCYALTSMPDASALTQLKDVDLPSHLKGWKAGGRKAFSAEGR